MNDLLNVFDEEYQNVLQEMQECFFDIPFGNSKFQTEMFVLAAQITPERVYRQLGLSIMSKLNELKDFHYNYKKELVEIDRWKAKLIDPQSDKFEKQIAQIEIDRFNSFDYSRKKMIQDVISELNVLYEHFKKFPRYTRQQFEDGEKTYFEQKLNRQILGFSGAKESLINMIDDKETLERFEQEVSKLNPDQVQKILSDLRETLLVGRLDLKGITT